jgi:hypothetical protein
MVMAALHATGGVGLVGSVELPQPDSIAIAVAEINSEIKQAFCSSMRNPIAHTKTV